MITSSTRLPHFMITSSTCLRHFVIDFLFIYSFIHLFITIYDHIVNTFATFYDHIVNTFTRFYNQLFVYYILWSHFQHVCHIFFPPSTGMEGLVHSGAPAVCANGPWAGPVLRKVCVCLRVCICVSGPPSLPCICVPERFSARILWHIFLVYQFACLHICTFAYLHLWLWVVGTYSWCINLRVCMFACLHVCMFAFLHVCMFAYLHICIFAHLHIAYLHICTFAYLHLQIMGVSRRHVSLVYQFACLPPSVVKYTLTPPCSKNAFSKTAHAMIIKLCVCVCACKQRGF